MKRNLLVATMLGSLALFAQNTGQTGSASGNTSTTSGTQGTSGNATQSGAQSRSDATSGSGLSGILMDASCSAIANRSGGSTTSSNADMPRSTATAAAGATGASSTDQTGATTRRATEQHQGTGEAVGGASSSMPRRTERAAGASAGTSTSADATAGRTTQSDASQSAASTGRTETGLSNDSTRSRAGEGAGAGGGRAAMMAVREKYADCMVKTNTSSFALYSNGRVYLMDDAANQMIKQQFSSGAFSIAEGSPRFMGVTVNGSPTGDRLSVTSIQQRRGGRQQQ